MIRSLPDTIDRMLALIPDDQELLLKDLCNARGRAVRTHPDAMEAGWRHVASVLGMRLPRGANVVLPEWAVQIIDIFCEFSEAA